MTRLPNCGEPDAQPWALAPKYADGSGVQVLSGRVQVHVPALQVAVGALDPGRHDTWVARRDDALGRQPAKAGANRPLS